jgi:hypothetical protein
MPVIPLFQQVKTAPPPRPTAPPANAPAASVPSESAAAPPAPSENEPREASADAPPPSPGDSRLIQMPPRDPDARPRGGSLVSESGAHKVDPEAFARATDDFMRTSPVLGATGRKVQRPNEDTGFDDPDAIAVASMVHDLARLDVPAGRQPELRARLLDLARRIEQGELDWSALRKAVWFAMEYPELARRLMPVLLPWIDRAA